MNEVNSYDDEISLTDLINALAEGWRWLLGMMLLGIGIAVLILIRAVPEYEARGVMQVGQVGQVGQAGEAVSSVPVESAQEAIIRMKEGAFQLDAANLAHAEKWSKSVKFNQQSKISNMLKFNVVKGTERIEVIATGSTRDEAVQIIRSITSVLARRHDALLAPNLAKMKEELHLSEMKLAEVKKEYIRLKEIVEKVPDINNRFNEFVLAEYTLQSKSAELLSLQNQIGALNAAIKPPHTQTAMLVEDVFASEQKMELNIGLTLMIGLTLGALSGMFVLFCINTWRNARKSRYA